MAAKTYNLTLNKNNNTSTSCTFTIPQVPGTYNLKLKLGSGDAIDAGNIVVDSTERTYRLVLGLSDGTSIDAGTLTTPIADGNQLLPPEFSACELESGTELYVEISNYNNVDVICYITVYDENGGVYGATEIVIGAGIYDESVWIDLSSSLTGGTAEAYFEADGYSDSDIITSDF